MRLKVNWLCKSASKWKRLLHCFNTCLPERSVIKALAKLASGFADRSEKAVSITSDAVNLILRCELDADFLSWPLLLFEKVLIWTKWLNDRFVFGLLQIFVHHHGEWELIACDWIGDACDVSTSCAVYLRNVFKSLNSRFWFCRLPGTSGCFEWWCLSVGTTLVYGSKWRLLAGATDIAQSKGSQSMHYFIVLRRNCSFQIVNADVLTINSSTERRQLMANGNKVSVWTLRFCRRKIRSSIGCFIRVCFGAALASTLASK